MNVIIEGQYPSENSMQVLNVSSIFKQNNELLRNPLLPHVISVGGVIRRKLCRAFAFVINMGMRVFLLFIESATHPMDHRQAETNGGIVQKGNDTGTFCYSRSLLTGKYHL